jgi:hypothetical protein
MIFLATYSPVNGWLKTTLLSLVSVICAFLAKAVLQIKAIIIINFNMNSPIIKKQT